MRKKRIWLCLCVILVSLCVLGGFLFLWYWNYRTYQNVFYEGTLINGMDVSHQTVDQAATAAAQLPESVITLQLLDGTETIDCSAIDLKVVCDVDEVQDLLQQQDPEHWYQNQQQTHSYQVSRTYQWQETLLESAVQDLQAVSGPQVKAPKDAYLEKTSKGFVIIPEDHGNTLNVSRVVQVIQTALQAGQFEVDLVENDCYETASILQDDPNLVQKKDALNTLCQREIRIDLTDGEEILDVTILSDWLQFDGTNAVFDTQKVDDYVSYLVGTYTTYGTERDFHTSKGTVISVGGSDGDTYGFYMDPVETKARLWSALESKGGSTVVPAWTSTALVRDSVNGDIGTTYVEISIEDQHMWYYRDGELYVDTDVTTGMMVPGRMTPTGVFQIMNKLEDYTMTGSYGSAWSNYVMPIDWSGICIHDAPWRSLYGGDYYIQDGSHGCINTPYEPMKAIFEVIELGTPVVIY